MGELYYRIANKSKVHAFPGGVCPTVGTGGHFSGGGYGTLMRKYGLSVDNIIDAKLVDVNGKILDRKSMGEDYFWAIRGGGGASFGVILSWKIKLVSVPKQVTYINVTRTLEQDGVANAVYSWQTVAPRLPKDIFLRLEQKVVNASEEGKKTVQVSFLGLFLGQIDELLPSINKSFPGLGLQKNNCLETSWIETTLRFAEYPVGTSIDVLLDRPTKPKDYFKNRSDYVKKPISKEGLRFMWQNMIELENIYMQWNAYGGRMKEISASETPFPHRKGNLFLIQYIVSWLEGGIEVNNHNINLSRTFYESMTPYVSSSPRESFQNYRDLDIGANPSNHTDFGIAKEYGRKYFKENFDRLVEAKTLVDPDNFFKNQQSIPPKPKREK